MSKEEQYKGPNCLSFVAERMGWSVGEFQDIGIDMYFYKKLTLEKFLLLYSSHVGRSCFPHIDLLQKSNIVTFTYLKGKPILYHVAVVDRENQKMIWHRLGWKGKIRREYLENSQYQNYEWIDYWKIPKTENFRGFVDKI